jgi:hypothetical protein
MNSRLAMGLAAVGMISLAFSLGCDFPPPRVKAPPISASGAAAKAMELYDTNKDSKISGAELDKCPGLKASLKVMKTDKDKGITSEMIVERIKRWQASGVGRTSMSCQVVRGGQPLVDATVKFVPEKFLADWLTETATGKTNQTGTAMVSLPITETGPDAPPPGICPGIYRVEITKDGVQIPAKYNTNTEFGQEVSLDNLDMQRGGVKFILK